MIFRQLFDRETCTYTYLLADKTTREAIVIDSVKELVARDQQLLQDLDLTLVATLETHVHADHVTGAGLLRQSTGATYGVSAAASTRCADRQLKHGDRISFGGRYVQVRATPGHTDTCISYVLDDESMVFTGDALMVRGCGRTDFQSGDAQVLYESVHEQLFSLPEDCVVYPAHDYKGRTATTIREERDHNPRLGGEKTAEDFKKIMDNLGLANPKQIHIAVPGNMQCGCPAVDEVWAPIHRGTGAPQVSAEWVELHRDEVRIIDVREQSEYYGPLGHLPESELIPLSTLETLATTWKQDVPTVLVCRSGGRSDRGALTLERLGFTRVASMTGGMSAIAQGAK